MMSTMTASQSLPASPGYGAYYSNMDVTSNLENLHLDEEEFDDDIDYEALEELTSSFSNHDRFVSLPTFPSHDVITRTSHLSGGGLVNSRNDYVNVISDSELSVCRASVSLVDKEKRFSCHFSGGGLISVNDTTDQISPSIPLSFELPAPENTQLWTNPYTCTNPFRSSTNPFLPQRFDEDEEKSPSQCSTRPASPISNPFSSPSSFILAVPVLPIVHTNSSTQTEDPIVMASCNSDTDLECLMNTMKSLRISGWYYENLSWQESVVLLRSSEPGTFLVRNSSDPNFLFSLSVQTHRGPTSVRIHYVNGKYRLDAEQKLVPHMPLFDSVLELVDYYIENTRKNKDKCKKINKWSRTKESDSKQSKEQVWIDAQGNIYSSILLVKPLYKRNHIAPLQHMARLTINTQLRQNKKHVNAGVRFQVVPVYDDKSPFDEFSFSSQEFSDKDVFSEEEPPPCNCEDCTDLPIPCSLVSYLREYPYCH